MRDSPLPARAADEYSSSSYKEEEDKSMFHEKLILVFP
jgi:hypothetical protein